MHPLKNTSPTFIKIQDMNNKYFCFIQTLTLILCCLSYMLVFFYRYTPTVLTNQLSKSLNVTKDRISVFSSMYFWTYAAMQPIGGILSDVLSPGKLISLSTLISATGSIMMGESSNFGLACFARCLVGVGCGPIFVSSIRLIANWYSPTGYAIANGILLTMGATGGCLAQGPLSTLCEVIDWKWAFRISTIIGFFISIICFFFIKTKASDYGFDTLEYLKIESKKEEPKEFNLASASLIDDVDDNNYNPLHKHSICQSLKNNVKQSFENLKIVIKTPQVYVFIIWDIFAPSCYYNMAGLWGSRYFQEVMDVKKKTADYWILVISLSVIVGGLLFPPISNLTHSRKWVLCISTFIGMLSALGFVFINHNIGSWSVLILMFLFGLGSNGNIPILNTLIKETNYDVAGTMLGFINFFPFFSTGILQILSPVFINWAEPKDHSPDIDTHSPRAYQYGLWLTITVYLTISTISTLFMKETYKGNNHD
ncbi:hypothetical protein M9Y10_034864 [Tritrichomonas musculus]|uniref:Lysosomal dipeptide transporter MFSD1 n=1 Tax=Tritrichomonas musculus TaxID=1915356 RepID=A0ABR2KG98_9EUKA